MLIVFDTNTLISAFLFPNSIPGKCFHSYRSRFDFLFSNDTFQEFERVIEYPKFHSYLNQEKRNHTIQLLQTSAIFIEVTTKCNDCRDISDNKFLDLAINGKADIIVSGDSDLLILHPYKDIPILTSRNFMDVLLNNK